MSVCSCSVGTRPEKLEKGRGVAHGATAQGVDSIGDMIGSVIQNEKSHRETPMGLPAGRKRKNCSIYWALTLGNSPFRYFSQVVSLKGSYHHLLVMKEETKAASREVTQPVSQS